MHRKFFLNDAIDAGYKPKEYTAVKLEGEMRKVTTIPIDLLAFIEVVLADPAAWCAVGVTRGWPKDNEPNMRFGEWAETHWKGRMVIFFQRLADGKTIDEALSLI